MAHRGRLNLLTAVLQYSHAALFHKIKGGSELPEELGAEGDILSHLGWSLSVQLLFYFFIASCVLTQLHRRGYHTEVVKVI